MNITDIVGYATGCIDLDTGALRGEEISVSERTMAGMEGYYRDELARSAISQDTIVYRVESILPVPDGQSGGIGAAVTHLYPGVVGDEFYMTRGHFHAAPDLPEMELCLSGEGVMVLMDRNRRTWIEPMRRGSIVAVPPGVAHKAANTGNETLVFVSFWPMETGHDYETIRVSGFGGRVREVDGVAQLIVG